MAQSVKRLTSDLEVCGSIPAHGGSDFFYKLRLIKSFEFRANFTRISRNFHEARLREIELCDIMSLSLASEICR